jgi:hypothetical protein
MDLLAEEVDAMLDDDMAIEDEQFAALTRPDSPAKKIIYSR